MPYRDGVRAARAGYEAELEELHECADSIGQLGSDVPARLRVEISDLVRDTARPARSMAEVERAKRSVHELGLALDVARDMATFTRAARRAGRRRQLAFAAIAGPIVLALGASVAGTARNDFIRADQECSEFCDQTGLCHANAAILYAKVDWDERCVAETDRDCAGPCQAYGACAARDGRCVATSDAQCRSSNACATGGACTALQGRCGAGSDADCRASAQCRTDGRCSLGDDARCDVLRDADCAASSACAEEQHCAFYQGKCVTAAFKECRTGSKCEKDGLCALTTDGCRAVDDADCAFSSACLDHQRCAAEDGACVRVHHATR